MVHIGRASEPRTSREGDVLRIGVPDPCLSSEHLVVTRRPASWELEDPGSKNGTFVDARRITRVAVTESTCLRVGETFVLIRPTDIDDPELPDDLDASMLDDPPGLATLEPSLAASVAALRRVAATPTSVLVHGETGTGKELAARAIHALSGRSGQFVAVNCGALTGSLLQSELFGHVAGAFSGAKSDRTGWVASADGGTLFLDEVAELSTEAQAALLRVLQEGEVVPVGSTSPRRVDVRFVAATHRDLERAVADGSFREDLLARLCGYRFVLPPVRERVADRGLLVRALLARADMDVRFTAAAGERIMSDPWRRNVRELDKALLTAAALAGDEPIDATHLPPPGEAPRRAAAPGPDDEQLRARLVALLQEHEGNVSGVARAMGKHRQQIQKWLRRLGLDAERYRR